MKGLHWAMLVCLGSVSVPGAAHNHDFAYRVMGDARVAPLQVFDDGVHTYLQFRPDQPLPAVFVQEGGQLRLAEHRVQGHYLILPQTSDHLEVRIGTALARVQYQGQRGQAMSISAPAAGPAQPGFATQAADQHLRGVLQRWTRQVGWTFDAEHWAVDIDIPLAGQAFLGEDFKTAVRALLRSTEMTRRPLQPCFYTNQVLRVIAATQSCQPGLAREAS